MEAAVAALTPTEGKSDGKTIPVGSSSDSSAEIVSPNAVSDAAMSATAADADAAAGSSSGVPSAFNVDNDVVDWGYDVYDTHRLDQLMELKQVANCDVFEGNGLPTGWGRLYGGQILGQAIVAAAETVPEELLIHSMHGYFLLAGESRTVILYEVDRIHSGRSFARRTVRAMQANKVIFTLTASFAKREEGAEYQIPAVDLIEYLKARQREPQNARERGLALESNKQPRPFRSVLPDFRPGRGLLGLESPEVLLQRGVELQRDSITGTVISLDIAQGDRWKLVWRKHEEELPDDAPWAAHAAVIAYITDFGTVGQVKQPLLNRGQEFDPFGSASLDHAMHFHRQFRCDRWLLFHQWTDVSHGSRGLASMQIFTPEGQIVCSLTQEALIRLARL